MTDTPQQVPFVIRNRWDNRILYSTTIAKSLAEAVVEAVAARTCLNDADLNRIVMPVGARLDGARLDGARLDGASLVGASLVGASLDGASLVGASLVGASLVGASLVGASLVGASLVGASLDGASLRNGAVVAKGSRVAYAGPVGSGARTVFAFMAKPDEKHQKPWLVLQCGCFTGDEKQYRARIAENYQRPGVPKGDKATYDRWHKQCLAALSLCRCIAATWTIEVEKPAAKAKAAKAVAK